MDKTLCYARWLHHMGLSSISSSKPLAQDWSFQGPASFHITGISFSLLQERNKKEASHIAEVYFWAGECQLSPFLWNTRASPACWCGFEGENLSHSIFKAGTSLLCISSSFYLNNLPFFLLWQTFFLKLAFYSSKFLLSCSIFFL